MAWPYTPLTTYVQNSLPAIKAADLNSIQAQINTLSSYSTVFGDGSDGDVTISGGTTTLARDMFYNNLTISATGILITAGFRVFVKKTLTMEPTGAGLIHNNGSGLVSGAVGTLLSGGAGGVGVNGVPGANTANSLGGSGGRGGNTGASGGTGSGGVATQLIATNGTIRQIPACFTGYVNGINAGVATSFAVTGGGGGGGGGNSIDPVAGGPGGGGGGVVLIAAAVVVDSNGGGIRARGAAGASSAGGSGGGGGGGVVILVYLTKTGTTLSAAVNTTGGAAGGATGANPTPQAGSNGQVFEIVLT